MIAYKLVSEDFKSYMIRSDYYKNYYTLDYKLHKETHKIKNTLGIFCFNTLENVKAFYNNMALPGKLLLVQGIGNFIIPPTISRCLEKNYLNRFYKMDVVKINKIQKGTICFDSIIPTEDASSLLPY